MSQRSLSKRESDLILAMEWEKKRLVSLAQIAKRLRCSKEYAAFLAHALCKKGWLEPLARGQYQLIGADRGPKGVPEMNPYLAARILPKPYFFAYLCALSHHGLTVQVPYVIHVALTRRKRPMEIKNVRFKFIPLAKKRFFGYEETTAFGEKIKVSDLERAVLDALDRPDLVGGIETAAQALAAAGKKLDHPKLMAYLKKMDDMALVRRFGYLSERLKIVLPKELLAYLKTQIPSIPAYLGSPKRWNTKGALDKNWNLIINVPEKELFGETRIT
ncbi:MAG: hypothetical protein HY747_08640 [Elusimicrobia bacterium]|nr:hypothetical protein [Elusimicrobiota bacterium]